MGALQPGLQRLPTALAQSIRRQREYASLKLIFALHSPISSDQAGASARAVALRQSISLRQYHVSTAHPNELRTYSDSLTAVTQTFYDLPGLLWTPD